MTELQRLLQSVMDAADSSMGKLPVAQGSPVLVGAASQIQNAQDLAPEIELDAETGWFVEVDSGNTITRAGWDPREEVTDAIIWRADQGVTLTNDEITGWDTWWPEGESAYTAVATTDSPPDTSPPTWEEGVFGHGARRLPALSGPESFFMRRWDRVSDDLQMGDDKTHTLLFWVYFDPAAVTLPMTICSIWGAANDSRSYWLGVTADGKFTYKVSSDGESVAASISAANAPATAGWYRVAGRYDGSTVGIGVAILGSDMTWASAAYATDLFETAGPGLYVGGGLNGDRFAGRITAGYYFSSGLDADDVDVLAGAAVEEPIPYSDILTNPLYEGAIRDDLVGCWPLDEPSGGYAYDKCGLNNLHWGFWWQGAGPAPGAATFPAARLRRTGDATPTALQYFTCDDLGAVLSDSIDPQSPNHPHRLMTLIAVVQPETYLQALEGLVGLGNSSSSWPYRMWETNAAYHRDNSSPAHDASAWIYADPTQAPEESPQTSYGGLDTSAHVLCTTWGPAGDLTYALTLYVDDPTAPFEPPHDMAGKTVNDSYVEVDPITFDRFSFGAVRRSGTSVIYPFDGYIGILIVVPRLVTDEERVYLMQWAKHTARLA